MPIDRLPDRPKYFTDAAYLAAARQLDWKAVVHPSLTQGRNLPQLLMDTLAIQRLLSSNHGILPVVWQGPGVYAVSAYPRVGSRAIVNTYKVPCRSSASDPISRRLNDKVLRHAIKHALGVIAISSAQSHELRQLNPRTAFVHFAADAEFWTPGEVRRSFFIDLGVDDYVLVVGDVDRDEEIVARAMRRLRMAVVRVTRDDATARRAAAILVFHSVRHRVFLRVGYAKLRELYRGARFVIIPALTDSHPAGMTSMTEAMSCGKAVLLPAGLTSEDYIENGRNGLALAAWSEATVADTLSAYLDRDRATLLGMQARSDVERRLNYETSGRELAQFLRPLCEDG